MTLSPFTLPCTYPSLQSKEGGGGGGEGRCEVERGRREDRGEGKGEKEGVEWRRGRGGEKSEERREVFIILA